ncbi:hypothetical protein AAHC03_09120 [Spirometra sp. Aus1]
MTSLQMHRINSPPFRKDRVFILSMNRYCFKFSIQPIIFSSDEIPIQQAEVDAAVYPKAQKPKSADEEQVAAAEETTEVAAKAAITSEQATEEVEQAQE